MKFDVPGHFATPLPRRDIVAICGYLNRARRPSVDGLATSRAIFLDRIADAARMQ
jgi:hypothetical protein